MKHYFDERKEEKKEEPLVYFGYPEDDKYEDDYDTFDSILFRMSILAGIMKENESGGS